ncbi:MAG: L-serine ammonia-lyase, iron-sulfur-dependent, subunit alpha, partial [Acetivibrio sp.]
YLSQGDNEMIMNSVAFALMNCMGLVCDPVAGLVQVPCAQRNASQAVNGLLSADLALAGMKSVIPPDQVVDAMYKVGKMLPLPLKETAMGGIANTPKGKQIAKDIFESEGINQEGEIL